jgi:hypothetical protein
MQRILALSFVRRSPSCAIETTAGIVPVPSSILIMLEMHFRMDGHGTLSILLKSALIGSVLGTLPVWPFWYQLGDPVQVGVSVLMLPGLLVSLVLSGGHLHDVGLVVTITASCVIYTALTYVFFRARAKGRQ